MALIYNSTRTLVWREIEPDDNLGGCWTQFMVFMLLAYIYTLPNSALAFFHSVPQLLAIIRTKSGGRLSIVSQEGTCMVLLWWEYPYWVRFYSGWISGVICLVSVVPAL